MAELGTVRREPGEGFAHAIKVEQPEGYPSWLVVDAWGPCDSLSDDDVEDWPVVYVPTSDSPDMAMEDR